MKLVELYQVVGRLEAVLELRQPGVSEKMEKMKEEEGEVMEELLERLEEVTGRIEKSLDVGS